MKVILLALDPYINFYIKIIPQYTTTGIQSLDWALNELDKLSGRELTGHAGINHLQTILSNLSKDDAIVIERVIGKDLRAGLAEGIVNAVIKDYIKTFPCLLARPFDEKNIKNIVYPAFSQKKGDGLRANIIIENKIVTICGRSGREIDTMEYLDDHFLSLRNHFSVDCVFDGEMIVVDEKNSIVDRKTGNGILNKAIRGTISDEEASRIKLLLWDVIPLNEFKLRKSTQEYKHRFQNLIDIISKNTCNIDKSSIIDYRVVHSLEESVDHFNEMIIQGEEGIILKNYCHLYEDTRSKHLVKMKSEKDCDLEIISWNEGKGKYIGQVGSLICASRDHKVEVSISGFTEDLRLEITKNINNLIGSIVTIKYNERISSKSTGREDVDSLFLPRFGCFRDKHDKSLADSSDEIK
jgi:DNA ligase-1